ncbi:Fis family transcriptional regulator [Shewanella youngdeokensis]|uniref:Fis family transcriptional regulator n=1 Tax=Shewanella youngdeokensis TaxID=2999068 RepID=A0ABZ0K427_9GAMM|nr:Fis family transcriptional regulator [Shewanella sp. DAU334]
MRKSDKKINNAIRISLTEVCEHFKGNVLGFMWLTHKVDFAKVNLSLQVTFMFATNESLWAAKREKHTDKMTALTVKLLAEHDIHMVNAVKQCRFET